ncbi:MAG: hypothetical protein K0Q91_399 [Fibrobacteria bacterium]|jgi:hypothetical protein|nr:hypothetical protein [Fibrobacteria bacterium]
MRHSLATLAALLALTVTIAQAQAPQKKSELGFNLGWGGPSGNGLEYAYYLQPAHAVSGGIGFSLAGAKYALGYRYYLHPDAGATPYFGAALSGASGTPVTVTVNDEEAKYDIQPGLALAPRAGFRFRTRLISWYVNAGYHVVVAGGGADYKEGSTDDAVRKFADAVALGGVEISASMLFRF